MIKKKLIIKGELVFKRYTLLDTSGEHLCDGCSKLIEGSSSSICSLGQKDFDFCCKIGFVNDHLIYRL